MQRLSLCIAFLWALKTALANRFVVSLKQTESVNSFLEYDVNYPQAQQVAKHIKNPFEIGTLSGFSGEFSKEVIARLQRCPLVADITPDIAIQAFETETQDQCPVHLARLSKHGRVTNEDLVYMFDTKASGAGINAYVLDSGMDIYHPEFEGRAQHGMDFTSEGLGDSNGHGTHVAGIIGSRTYGVAKNVNLIEVKTLGAAGGGSLSKVVSAIEFAVKHHKKSGLPGVANLLLGAAKNKALNAVVNAAAETGLVMVVAAGNSNRNACEMSPASAKLAITVGAIDAATDALASFSNWGECVDIFAPGVFVESVNAKDRDSPHVLSGTSMAAPVISGLVSGLLSSGVSPHDVKNTIIEMSIKNKIKRRSLFMKGRTANRIAHNGLDLGSHDYDSDSDDE